VLGVEGMNPNGVAQFREPISQVTDGGNFARLNAGVNQGLNPSLPPALGHRIEIRIKVAENDVAMGVNQRCHRLRHGESRGVILPRLKCPLRR
jgi:hypothetical protein